MLTINNVSFFFGSRPLYKEASLHIKPKNRIGLVGANGTGKTTLLKLIIGDIQPDVGEISKSKDCTIGFLNQDLLSYESSESILDVAMQAFERQLMLQHKIDDVLKQMEVDYSEDLVEKLSKMQEEFEAMDGYTIQSKAEAILEGLGFKTEDLKRPLKEFSGGWRMRVMLAKLLLQQPSILMLDEPTNHLDLPSIQWLETYLNSYEGAIIIVSHDREFLERAVNITVEVSGYKLNSYSGNYSFFLEEKALRNELQKNAFKNQQQKIKQTEQFINRFRAKATKARQVQSKVKMLDKIDLIEDVVEDSAHMSFNFAFKQQSGRFISIMENVSKAYGNNLIFENTNISINKGDKIALIGANGKGKSTLLRMIAGTERYEGETRQGHNVIPAFYAQHQLEALNIQNEILDELKQSGSERTELELRALLGCFLFKGDDVFKKIKVLSGGEKSRVALAKTLLSEANFLLLDEPTNHLDIQSVNILISALQQYAGSYLVVSHDRHFISQIANKIWYIENNEVKEYVGTYDEYQYWVNEVRAKQENQNILDQENSNNKEVSKSQIHREEHKLNAKQRKQLEKKVQEIEDKISTLETEKENMEAEMAKPEVYSDSAKLAELNEKYGQVKIDLEQANDAWEQAVEELEE